MKKIPFLPAFLAGLLLFSSAYAEEETNTVFVTGGRTDVRVVSQASTYIFTQQDIDSTASQNLAELLSRVPGFSFEHTGGQGSATNLNVRGTNSDHVLVLIDGVRASSATLGTTAIQFIALAQVERIEVVKGPVSGVYGADALGGVVQIFTKKGKDSTGGYVDVGVASHNTKKIAAGFNSGSGDVYYGVNANALDTDGIDRNTTTTGINADKDGYDEKGLSFNVGRDAINGLDLDFIYSINKGHTAIDSFSGNVLDGTDFVNETASFSSSLPLTSTIDLSVKAGYRKDDQETFGANSSTFITRRKTATTYLTMTPTTSQSFVVGYDYYDDRVSATQAFTLTERDNSALFLEYVNNASLINFNVSLREDDSETYGKYTSGTVSLGFNVDENQKISLSYGESFKAPTFNELYYPFQVLSATYEYQGNSSLIPEEAKTIELDYIFSVDNFEFGASLYKTDIKNLISTQRVSGILRQPTNVDNVDIVGGELFFNHVFKNTTWGVAISHVDARDTSNEQRLDRRPRGTVNAYLEYEISNKLNVSTNWTAEDGRRQSSGAITAGYGLLDLGASYAFTKNDIILFSAKNIFDKEYTIVSGFNTEGATFDLTYKHRF